jgi:hypothetical protein
MTAVKWTRSSLPTLECVHRVMRRFMEPAQDVELGIVSTPREVVLRGVLHLAWEQVVAASVLLLALGGLLRFAGLRLGHSSRAQ